MDDLLLKLNEASIHYLLIGGQAMRLFGMPRFSMDWDLYIPPRDPTNFEKLNALLADDLDAPLVPLGPRGENFIQTRLKDWDDQESWREFFNTYWRLIYGVAVKAGLSDAEAQDAVQETVLEVAKKMPGSNTIGVLGHSRAGCCARRNGKSPLNSNKGSANAAN